MSSHRNDHNNKENDDKKAKKREGHQILMNGSVPSFFRSFSCCCCLIIVACSFLTFLVSWEYAGVQSRSQRQNVSSRANERITAFRAKVEESTMEIAQASAPLELGFNYWTDVLSYWKGLVLLDRWCCS